MKNKNTQEKLKDVLYENKIPRQMIGYLLKEEVSSTDLAVKIYGRKEIRHGIIEWLKYFEEKGWIENVQVKVGDKRKLFRAKLDLVGNFDKEEEKFVRFFLGRFWNPVRKDPIKSIYDLLSEALIIKKLDSLMTTLAGYNPIKDISHYKKNESKFWKDKNFRDKFLEDIKEEGIRDYEKKIKSEKRISIVHIPRDFLLVCLLIPDSIQDKFMGGHNIMGDPLFTIRTLLDY